MEKGVLAELIAFIAKLPGLGPRSARRIVLQMLKNPSEKMGAFANLLTKVMDEVKRCAECGNIDIVTPCNVCTDNKRDPNVLCVVEDIADLWALERGMVFKGRYHILGGYLSPINGVTPDKLNIDSLVRRVASGDVKEVIIATNSTLEGQSTGFYISDLLQQYNVRTTRLAHGIPLGAEIDYMDEGTLSHALKMRQD
ncbi:MAG: recombination mediator RecR, partial [Alphaproteobacteria bacterium]